MSLFRYNINFNKIKSNQKDNMYFITKMIFYVIITSLLNEHTKQYLLKVN